MNQMTRLSARQRRVLGEFAHMRVPREDAWLTTERLCVLLGVSIDNDGWWSMQDTLDRLERRGLVEEPEYAGRWRITDAGRDAL